jgi:hypothetical protein
MQFQKPCVLYLPEHRTLHKVQGLCNCLLQSSPGGHYTVCQWAVGGKVKCGCRLQQGSVRAIQDGGKLFRQVQITEEACQGPSFFPTRKKTRVCSRPVSNYGR